MPTTDYADGYRDGFRNGFTTGFEAHKKRGDKLSLGDYDEMFERSPSKPKRKLSAWNKYVKNKRNHIRYRDGTLNLKKMAVAFRRKKRR